MNIYPSTIKSEGSYRLACNRCGKSVSSAFMPLTVEGFEGLVVRAWIECPECIQIMTSTNPGDSSKK